MKYLASGHWGYVVSRIKQRLDKFLEGNVLRITART